MKIVQVMKRSVVSIRSSASIGQATAVFVAQHVGTLPVVDDAGRLIGLLPLGSVLELVMPDFVRLLKDFDFVHDFGAVEARQPSVEALARPVQEVMAEPVAVEEDCGLLRAFALLRQHNLSDLPVVATDGRLIGIVSHVDVGTALLVRWGTPAVREGGMA